MMAASILFEKKAELGLLDEHTSHVTTTFPAEGFNESLGGLPLITFKTVWITWFVELMLKNNYQLQNYSSKVSTFTNLDMSWQWNLVMRTLEVTSNHRCYIPWGRRVHFLFHNSQEKWAVTESLLWIPRSHRSLLQPCGCNFSCSRRILQIKSKARGNKKLAHPKNTSGMCQESTSLTWYLQLTSSSENMSMESSKSKEPLWFIQDRLAHVNNVNSRNTKLYNIYTKVMEFQVKTGRLPGYSHTLQQHTTKNNQKAVILDH